ncbi:MAG: polysaccharide deacetylase family protein [Anaerolineae bacterium]
MCAILAALPSLISANEALIELHYEIDRSALPTLNEYELTLLISVGNASEIAVFDQDKQALVFKHVPEQNLIVLTSEANEIFVNLAGVTEFEEVGTVIKAPLKDNKKWAWSHAFDDNHYLEAPIEIMLEHNLPATMYIVGDWIDEGYGWEGDLTATEMHELMAAGWSLGNHTAGHDNNCGEQRPSKEERRASILETDQILDEIIQSSDKPNYKVLSFAVPCGGMDRFDAYHELILEMRYAQQTNILFSEGGHEEPMRMNIEPPFNFNQQIKRDLSIDGNIDNGATIMALFDAMHTENEVVWYNSFSHNAYLFGDNTQKLNDITTYFVNTYGANGTDEAWMAPADVIYSYLLNRDLAVVTLVSDTVPAITPTFVPTTMPTTTTPTPPAGSNNPPTGPTPSATPSPTDEPTDNGKAITPAIYLPLITNK